MTATKQKIQHSRFLFDPEAEAALAWLTCGPQPLNLAALPTEGRRLAFRLFWAGFVHFGGTGPERMVSLREDGEDFLEAMRVARRAAAMRAAAAARAA